MKSALDLRRIAAVLVATSFWALTGIAAAQAPLQQARDVLARIERGDTAEQLIQEAAAARHALDAHLAAEGDDADALILAARLSLAEGLSQPAVFAPGDEQPAPSEPFQRELAYLDRALARNPDSGEAHYWKARLYGMELPGIYAGVVDVRMVNRQAAISHSREAVRLDPQRVDYREALAILLAGGGDMQDALKAVAPLASQNNFVHRLLNDLVTFPLPEGSAPDQLGSRTYGEMQLTRGRIPDAPLLRVRLFNVPMTVTGIEAFYRRQWPRFRLFQNRSGGSATSYGQYLRFSARGLSPAARRSDLERAADDEGIFLAVTELRNLTQEDRDRLHVPPDFGPVSSIIFYVNRRVRP